MTNLPKVTKTDLSFNTSRQKELMRVILAEFAEFDKRKQEYYWLEGMSTAHVAVQALLGDFTTLAVFWPKGLVNKEADGGVIYSLQEDTMNKAWSAVRSCLEQLEGKHYIERLGNEHERRWRPNKSLRGVTL
jgi:hypothetical protein